MKKLIVMAVAAMVAVSAMAEGEWMGNSVINAYINGTSTWYDGSLDSQNVDFKGANLGSLYSLTLGSQIEAYPTGVEAGNFVMGYQVYSKDGNPADDAWQTAPITWVKDEGNNSRWATGGNWDAPVQTSIDLSGCTDGQDYNIAVYFAGTVNNVNTGDGGNNFVASFTKIADPTSVPEPATMSLLGLGALAMVLRRKLRK
ncbi:MAG: PEP-CTERM sorting domain-containing protein [Kiritimatiellae bacterium]|nr:PEP-CTERM sorting domain-containing protein [Kiritimatiellia bacterium]